MNDTFRTFTWDADGNPVTIGPVSLTYDAFDRMVEQSVSGTNSEIVYSPAGVKLALMNGATLTKAFVPLTGGATAVYNSSGLAYYRHTDHLGSSRFASTPTQTLYSDAAYSPFGEPYASSGAIDNSFTGQNQDTTAGLYDFLFREQDPNQTRWTSPDPAGLASANPAYPQSWNRYAYVSNIPMEYVDPTGLFLCGSICDPPPPPPDPGGSGGGGGGAGGSGGGGGCTFFGPGGRCGGGAGGAGSIGGGNPGTPPGCPPGDACDPVSNPNSQTSQCNSIQTTYNQTAMANNFKWAMRFYGAVVGGAALGGPLGAAIGGALQSMNDESASDYANITQNAAQQWIAAGCSGSLQPAFPQ